MAKKSLNMIEKMMDPKIIDYYIINCAIPSTITIKNRFWQAWWVSPLEKRANSVTATEFLGMGRPILVSIFSLPLCFYVMLDTFYMIIYHLIYYNRTVIEGSQYFRTWYPYSIKCSTHFLP